MERYLNEPITQAEAQSLSDALQKGLKGFWCPFLEEGLCTVYKSRPARCRAYGSFLAMVQSVPLPMTCTMELERMEKSFVHYGHRELTRPLWKPYEQAIWNIHTKRGKPFYQKPLVLWAEE